VVHTEAIFSTNAMPVGRCNEGEALDSCTGGGNGFENSDWKADSSDCTAGNAVGVDIWCFDLPYKPMEALLFMDKNDAADLTFFTEECCRGNDCSSQEKCAADLGKVKSMALLDQELDLAGSGKQCLTQEDLDGFTNVNERETHPHNCAKINAKDHPYFDGGIQQVTASKGVFSFFSSRNNNFSNRDQTMGICVDAGKDCEFIKGIQKARNEKSFFQDASDSEIVGVAFSAMLGGAAFALLGLKAYTSRTGGSPAPTRNVQPAAHENWLKGATEVV